MPKITHDFVCDECGKPATINIQQNWQLFDITPKGDFKETDSWEGDDNSFYCDECYTNR
jgi:hypothetical protein